MKKYVNADFVIGQIEDLAEAYVDLIEEIYVEIRQGEGTPKDKTRIECYSSFCEELIKLRDMVKLLKALKGKEIE